MIKYNEMLFGKDTNNFSNESFLKKSCIVQI